MWMDTGSTNGAANTAGTTFLAWGATQYNGGTFGSQGGGMNTAYPSVLLNGGQPYPVRIQHGQSGGGYGLLLQYAASGSQFTCAPGNGPCNPSIPWNAFQPVQNGIGGGTFMSYWNGWNGGGQYITGFLPPSQASCSS